MKFYSKIKSKVKLGFRTPDHFKEKKLTRKPKKPAGFNPTHFKVQHKG